METPLRLPQRPTTQQTRWCYEAAATKGPRALLAKTAAAAEEAKAAEAEAAAAAAEEAKASAAAAAEAPAAE